MFGELNVVPGIESIQLTVYPWNLRCRSILNPLTDELTDVETSIRYFSDPRRQLTRSNRISRDRTLRRSPRARYSANHVAKLSGITKSVTIMNGTEVLRR